MDIGLRCGIPSPYLVLELLEMGLYLQHGGQHRSRHHAECAMVNVRMEAIQQEWQALAGMAWHDCCLDRVRYESRDPGFRPHRINGGCS